MKPGECIDALYAASASLPVLVKLTPFAKTDPRAFNSFLSPNKSGLAVCDNLAASAVVVAFLKIP